MIAPEFPLGGLHDLRSRVLTWVCIPSQVYISCQVMICKAGDPTTRCSRGCINSTQTAPRWKREALSQTARHFISQGPLRLHGSAESGPSPGKSRRAPRRGRCVWGGLLTEPLVPRRPEPEPGVHRRVSPRGPGHDQRSGCVQNEGIQGQISAPGHPGE